MESKTNREYFRNHAIEIVSIVYQPFKREIVEMQVKHYLRKLFNDFQELKEYREFKAWYAKTEKWGGTYEEWLKLKNK